MALPKLTLNRRFMMDFAAAEAPCFALGLVTVDGHETGFLAVRPDPAIPRGVLAGGIGFGHRLSAIHDNVLCQFAFNFYGFAQHSALVNPTNSMVCHILETMIKRRDYFFFILNPDNQVSAFRSALCEANLAGMRDNLPAMQAATTSREEYEDGVRAFLRAPDPPGTLLNWVCRENSEYLDLQGDVVVLPPAG